MKAGQTGKMNIAHINEYENGAVHPGRVAMKGMLLSRQRLLAIYFSL